MTPYELKYLNSVIKLHESGKIPIIFIRPVAVLLVLMLAIAIAITKSLYDYGSINVWAVISISLFLGVAVAMYAFYRHAYRSWFYIEPHINFESIKNHISIYEHNKTPR